MAAKFDQNDDSVVVIVGSGAGGGTLGNELAQKGVKVVVLEAGKRLDFSDFINDEWPSFTQLAWTDMRTTSGSWRVHKNFPNLPAWIVKSVGGTTTHWAGASLRFQEHEFKEASTYGHVPGANLLDWPITLADLEPYYAKAEDKMRVTRTGDRPGLPGSNNFKVFEAGAKSLATKRSTPDGWRSTPFPATAASPATKPASASRAASGGRNGRRSTPKSPRARRPATWRSARIRMSRRSNTMLQAR